MSRSRWTLLLSAVTCTVGIAAGGLVAFNAASAASAAGPVSCPVMQVVGVRGSGETHGDAGGYGATVRDVVDHIKEAVPGAASDEIDYLSGLP